MVTTIQVSQRLQKELSRKKFSESETYEDVIWDIIEDTEELSEETKKELAMARADVHAGRVHTLAEVKRKLCH